MLEGAGWTCKARFVDARRQSFKNGHGHEHGLGDLDARLEGIAKTAGSEEGVFSKLRRTRYGGGWSQRSAGGTKSGEGCITAAAACSHNTRDRPVSPRSEPLAHSPLLHN